MSKIFKNISRTSMKAAPLFSTLLALSACLSACSNVNSIYHWGSYEDLIYKMHVKPEQAVPKIQIERITTDIEKAKTKGKRVPPGVYAQLGVMYMAMGNVKQANVAFTQEKSLYPESVVLIDSIMNKYN